jgi:hypothetical protein
LRHRHHNRQCKKSVYLHINHCSPKDKEIREMGKRGKDLVMVNVAVNGEKVNGE